MKQEVPMKTRVQKWGNSLALRIPKAFAAEAGLGQDVAVELSLVDGRLVIEPLPEERLTLGDLLRGVTDDNIHGEWDTGPAVGKEIW
jgi:antitoxin MazE